MGLEDWARAIKYLHLSVEAHASSIPKTDPKYISVYKLYEKAKASRQQAAQGIPVEEQPPEANEATNESAPNSPTVRGNEVTTESLENDGAVSADVLFTNAETHLHDQVEHQKHISHGSHRSNPPTPLSVQSERMHLSPRNTVSNNNKSSNVSSPRDSNHDYDDFDDDFYPASPDAKSNVNTPSKVK